MIAEEEELKKRLLKSIESCRKELNNMCSELQLPPFEVQSCSRFFSPSDWENAYVWTHFLDFSTGGGWLHYVADGEKQPHTSRDDEGAQKAKDGRAERPHCQRPWAVWYYVHYPIFHWQGFCPITEAARDISCLPWWSDQREGVTDGLFPFLLICFFCKDWGCNMSYL